MPRGQEEISETDFFKWHVDVRALNLFPSISFSRVWDIIVGTNGTILEKQIINDTNNTFLMIPSKIINDLYNTNHFLSPSVIDLMLV